MGLRIFLLLLLTSLCCYSTIHGFSFGLLTQARRNNVASPPSTMPLLSASNVDPTSTTTDDSRRGFYAKVAATAASVASFSLGLPLPAFAVGGLNKVNAKLQGYGLPKLSGVAPNFTPLLHIYGKGKNRFPLLVLFSHPLDWIVTLPSNDANGEDGTIQAGEYAKGDTATLYIYNEPGHIADVQTQPPELFEKALIKAISQKGNNVYQNFKIKKVVPASGDDYGDQKYVLVDFKYELLTGAGFTIDRIGVASITSQGNAVEVLWSASTRQRYKNTEPQLREIVGSFRCWADGINLSDELQA